MNILFKITSRGRPERAKRAFDSIRVNAIQPYNFILSLDEDDMRLHDYKQWAVWFGIENAKVGWSTNKINAINRDVPKEGWDILVNVSDDQVFTVIGFDEIIRSYFSDSDTDRFLHFPDGNRTDLCTMSIIGREYYDRDKYIYHPDYVSYFCDQEAQDVAKIRRKYVYCDQQIFLHEHPDYGLAKRDRVYQEYHRFFENDKATYERRKELNFNE